MEINQNAESQDKVVDQSEENQGIEEPQEKEGDAESQEKEGIENGPEEQRAEARVPIVNENLNVAVPESLNDFGHIIRVELITATDDGMEEQVKVHEIEMTSGSTTIPTKEEMCISEMPSSDNLAIASVPEAKQLGAPEQHVTPSGEELGPTGDELVDTGVPEGPMDGMEPSASELADYSAILPAT